MVNQPGELVSSLVARWSRSPDRAVIFDFNGTLSNDEPILLRVFGEMFEEHLGWQLTSSDYFGRLAGRSDREIVELVVGEQGREDPALVDRLLRERRDRYCALVDAHSPIERGAVELLVLLREANVPLAIVTGAQRVDVDFVLSRRGVRGEFSVLVTEEDVSRGKPDPEGFLRAATLLGTSPSACLVFEDSLFGLRAARAAGMQTIAVTGTKSGLELQAEADAVTDELRPSLFDGVIGI